MNQDEVNTTQLFSLYACSYARTPRGYQT